jgi:hypothetical protein
MRVIFERKKVLNENYRKGEKRLFGSKVKSNIKS